MPVALRSITFSYLFEKLKGFSLDNQFVPDATSLFAARPWEGARCHCVATM
jgi:hypothetical protein